SRTRIESGRPASAGAVETATAWPVWLIIGRIAPSCWLIAGDGGLMARQGRPTAAEPPSTLNESAPLLTAGWTKSSPTADRRPLKREGRMMTRPSLLALPAVAASELGCGHRRVLAPRLTDVRLRLCA